MFVSEGSFAQNQTKVDSLLRLYKTAKMDTNEIRIVNDLVNVHLYNDAQKAKTFIDEGMAISQQLKNQKGIALFYYQNGVYFSFTSEKDSARLSYEKSIEYAGEDIAAKGKAISGLAIMATDNGNLKAADSLFQIALGYDKALNDSTGIAISYNQIGRIHQMKGHFQIAQNFIQKSVQILEKLDDEIRLADAYNSLAAIEMRQKNFKSSIPYNEKATAIYIKHNDDYFLPQSYLDLGIAYSKEGDEEKALDYWQKSLEISKQKKLWATEASIYFNLSKRQRDKKNYKEALRLGLQSLEASKTAKNRYKITQAENLLAQIYNLKNEPQKALAFSNKGVEGAQASSNDIALLTGLEARAEAYKKLGNYKAASTDYYDMIVLNDSIYNKEKSLQIEEQRAIFDTERKENDIRNLSLEVEKSELQKSLYAGGLFSALAIGGLVFFGFNQRNKRKELAYQQKEEKMKNEIAFKKKELISQTLHLVNKNTLIQDLKQKLLEIRKASDNQAKDIGQLVRKLDSENTSDANWEVFKSHFAAVHKDFEVKIKAYSDDITNNDVRLAAFLKMKLTTKEIAAMLNVLPESVTKTKYRLKKKFNLDADEDFDSFLENV